MNLRHPFDSPSRATSVFRIFRRSIESMLISNRVNYSTWTIGEQFVVGSSKRNKFLKRKMREDLVIVSLSFSFPEILFRRESFEDGERRVELSKRELETRRIAAKIRIRGISSSDVPFLSLSLLLFLHALPRIRKRRACVRV